MQTIRVRGVSFARLRTSTRDVSTGHGWSSSSTWIDGGTKSRVLTVSGCRVRPDAEIISCMFLGRITLLVRSSTLSPRLLLLGLSCGHQRELCTSTRNACPSFACRHSTLFSLLFTRPSLPGSAKSCDHSGHELHPSHHMCMIQRTLRSRCSSCKTSDLSADLLRPPMWTSGGSVCV